MDDAQPNDELGPGPVEQPAHDPRPLLTSLAIEQRGLVAELQQFDPVKTAATFGGLLTVPELQGNCLRLETLVHLSLFAGKTNRKPSERAIRQAFAAFEGTMGGSLEDPPESLLTGLITTSRGDFRVLEGIWEGASFFLQRIVNVVEGMPSGSGYDRIRESVFALLTLSEAVCQRANLERYAMGVGVGLTALPPKVASRASSFRRLLNFSEDDLRTLDIPLGILSPFFFVPRNRGRLLAKEFGSSELERHPIALHGTNGLYLLLPTAVSMAIRRFVIEQIDAAGMREQFLKALGRDYQDLFQETRLLGGLRAPDFRFQKATVGIASSFGLEVDVGLHLQFVFILDDLAGFEAGAFSEPDSSDPTPAIEYFTGEAKRRARERPDFKQGLTIVVPCGVGRPMAWLGRGDADKDWRLEFLAAADLETLGWLEGFKPLSLWRILDARDKVENDGVYLQNMNGLLNLVGWSRSLNGHLIPHGMLDDDFVSHDHDSMVVINQTDLKIIREQVAHDWDVHSEKDITGAWRLVRRDTHSIFEEDRDRPLYATHEFPPRAVYAAPHRSWWCELVISDGGLGEMAYERWRALSVWLGRAAPVLDAAFPTLQEGPIQWRAEFSGISSQLHMDHEPVDAAAAIASITIDVVDGPIVVTSASQVYDLAQLNCENVAERALVDGLVRAVARLAGVDLTQVRKEELVQSIVVDPLARQQHAFRNPSVRQVLRGSLPRAIVKIEREDDAASRLGLGWRVRSRSDGAWIEGKAACTDYLNRLVESLEGEIISRLRAFNREMAFRRVLENYEAAAADVEHWRVTSAAIVALHDDKDAARAEILEHEASMNAVFLGSRILLEFAICECPMSSGSAIGDLELGRLLSLACLIFQFGGCSDAIRWDVMEPRLRVTPLGDVHANWEFVDTIVDPYARATADVRIRDAIDRYPEHVGTLEEEGDDPEGNGPDVREELFVRALREQLGGGWDEVAELVRIIDELSMERQSLVLSLRRSEILAEHDLEGGASGGALGALIDNMTFTPRPQWRDTPKGFEAKDRHPWRFRRRLSVLRLPFFKLGGSDEDPQLLFAPGMVREALRYTTGNLKRGDFPEQQLSPLMARWKGDVAHERGSTFSKSVAQALRAQGWHVENEVAVTKIVGMSLPKDFGDVDVLAWNPKSGRVLAIECKDVHYRKTYGEVGEQLSDFKGEVRSNGKPDLLLKHLNRTSVLAENLARVASYVGMKSLERIETHLVFKNQVPMKFALGKIRERATVHLFSEIGYI